MSGEHDPDGHWAAARENVEAQHREQRIHDSTIDGEKHRVRVILAGRVLMAKMGLTGAEETAKLFALVPSTAPARGVLVCRIRYEEAVATYRAVFGIAPPEIDGDLHSLATHVERDWKPGMSEAVLRLAEKIIAAHKEPKP